MTRALVVGLLVLVTSCKPSGPAAPAAEPADPIAITDPVAPADPVEVAWPFRAWDRAEAIRFNDLPYGPRIPLRVYDAEHGWSPNIVERKPLDRAQAESAVERTIQLGGDLEVSKCPFPRHAVVLYAGDEPVGTVNVCFECGDILVWPELEPSPDYESWTEAQHEAWQRRYDERLKLYDGVFARWQAFFRDEVGFSIEPPPRP